MIGLAKYKLAKYFNKCPVLQPVLGLYLSNYFKNYITFANEIQQLETNLFDPFLCSFDISSLFKNVS